MVLTGLTFPPCPPPRPLFLLSYTTRPAKPEDLIRLYTTLSQHAHELEEHSGNMGGRAGAGRGGGAHTLDPAVCQHTYTHIHWGRGVNGSFGGAGGGGIVEEQAWG